MSLLRQHMLDAMELRGFAERTREAYLHWVVELARHTRTAPDQLETADLERFVLHLLRERQLAYSTCNQALQALRFLWRDVLKRPDIVVDLPNARVPQRLPEILSREEVARIITSEGKLRNRTLLMTTYAAGLRVSEVCHLRVADIDSARMGLRIEQGKGARDRYSLLPQALLDALRLYWRVYHPKVWLFPQRQADVPIDPGQAQKWFYAAKRRAGITKHTGIHGLRHAFATHLLEAGVDVRTIQTLMGHRCISTTMRYLHLSQQSVLSTTPRMNLLDGLTA